MPQRSKNIKRQQRIDRLHLIMAAFLILAAVVVWRLFRLQVLEGSFFRAVAADQRTLVTELTPERGDVYVRFGRGSDELQPLAINEQRSLIYAVPTDIENPVDIAMRLRGILELEDEEYQVILNRLSKSDDLYEPVAHKVSKVRFEQIKALNIPGIRFSPEPARIYPLGATFGNLTGFMGHTDEGERGRYGVEQAYEKLLAGEQGYLVSERDPRGYIISLADRTFTPATDGSDIILTLDPNIQATACRLLDKAVTRHEAAGGTIVIMEPQTGDIEALCINPHFDPNTFAQVESIDVYLNQAISLAYEPGSVFKVITMAAALDAGAVSPDTKYVDEGQIVFKDFTIRNARNKVYGEQNMNQVLEKSINTGAVFAALETGRQTFRKYVENFGFGHPTDTGLPAEAAGDLAALNESGEIFTATASYGQGITVTPMQLVQAFGAIANKGIMVKPRVLQEIHRPDGAVEEVTIEERGRVIVPQTAATLSAMLVNVVEEGYGDAARVPGFYVAGKTGTAQVAGSAGGYSEDMIHTFVGFAPIGKPRYVALVKLDNPQLGRFAAATAAPVFRELSSFLLQYYQVTPER